MSDEPKVEGFYQMRAKEIVDAFYDKGFFREDVSRDGFQDAENFIAYMLQTLCQSSVKIALLSKSVKRP